jgi:hypothetical protein
MLARRCTGLRFGGRGVEGGMVRKERKAEMKGLIRRLHHPSFGPMKCYSELSDSEASVCKSSGPRGASAVS